VAWDKPKTNIRKRLELYPEYKAGRKPAPPDFYEQIPILHELLGAFGWPLYELDDYEADDIMGTLAVQARDKGLDTMLVTSDLDMLQLVNGNVHVYALKRGLTDIELYSNKSFEAKYGLSVSQYLDLKSLKGDSSDNIPGVPGIGEKTAIGLLQQYKTLDNIYENLSLIKESVRKKLEAGKKLAYLSKELARIWTDAPLTLDLSAVDAKSDIQPAKILELFQRLEFRTLARQLPAVMQAAIADHMTGLVKDHVQSDNLHVGTQMFIANADDLSRVHIDPNVPWFTYSRVNGKHGREPELLSFSTNSETVYTFDLAKLTADQLRTAIPKIPPLIGYDVKTTLKVLLGLGYKDLPAVAHDVVIGAFLLNSLRREQTLTELAQSDLQYEGEHFEGLELPTAIERAPQVIAVVKALYEQQHAKLHATPRLPELAATIEWPVIPVLARMEYEGIQLDTAYLRKMSGDFVTTIADIEKQIYEQAGTVFNIGSPSQLANILFDKLYLGLPTLGIKKGKTGFSTAVSELDKLRGQHPIIDLITQWREVTKLKNTYVDTLPSMVDEHSRVHTTFNLTIAQTGRLSSTDPNLQNIPVRTELGRKIRTAFIAAPGKKLVSADYSQFELRLSAALSHDNDLVAMFNRDEDVHTATAAQVYHCKPEEVTKEMRRRAKAVNFGIIYGMSPHGLSIATGMTYEQAGAFIKEYMAFRKPLIGYLDELKSRARKDGYVATIFGRRRPMPDIHSSNFAVRAAAERAAINMPIQGTEADLMKLAMIKVDQHLQELGDDCKQLLQIHDSILVECPTAKAEQVAKILDETMEHIYPELPVKLTVDTSIADNWGEL
jgi:DNA polymerase-1